jgi:hypothetical protein
VGPALHLGPDEALAAQLDALSAADGDAGVEVLYRFADIDLFAPCTYWGARSSDCGQFERFKLKLGEVTGAGGEGRGVAWGGAALTLTHSPSQRRFAPLRAPAAWAVAASFDWQPAAGGARAMRRVEVTARGPGGGGSGGGAPPPPPPAVFDFVLQQRVGGPADGCWFTAGVTRVDDG